MTDAEPPRGGEPQTPGRADGRTDAYVFGAPRAAVRALAREIPGLAFSTILFVIGPGVAAHLSLSSPWRAVGVPLGVVLGVITAWGAWGLAAELRARCGLRVVPQFERALEPGPETYFSGHRIVARMEHLDAMAAAAGVRRLSEFGFTWDGAPATWFDAADGTATVTALLRRVEPSSLLHAELSALQRALVGAEAAGAGFRLVVVTGTGMNGMLWATLRDAGF